MRVLQIGVSLWVIVLLSSMVIYGMIKGDFAGPFYIVGPLAGLGVAFLLGLSVAKIGRDGIEFQREEDNDDQAT